MFLTPPLDRVFVHALNTVKRVPKTGASRPPASDRLRLYGLYKQAMEGDVDSVMERPSPGPNITDDEVRRERDKWDAWNSQKGLSRTESKRRYIEALIETMHRYATTPYVFMQNHVQPGANTRCIVMPKSSLPNLNSYGTRLSTTHLAHPTLHPSLEA